MVPDHGTQYDGNPLSHHGGMLEDGLTDRRIAELTDVLMGLDPFLYFLIPLRQSGE